MFDMSLPWWEFVLRGAVVYLFLMVMLRFTGKRQTGQLAPFDLILLLILSNALQNAMNGGDNSLVGGLISALTLIGLNELLTHHELSAALRAAGCADIDHVRSATLENNGQITVSLRPVPAREPN